MPTQRQKKVARLIIENSKVDKPLNGGQMLAKVGYAESMQTAKVNDVLQSEGVKEELTNLGFSEEGAKKVVAEILYNGEESNRLKAADQVFKIHGSYAPEKHDNRNVNIDVSKRDLVTKIAQEVIKKLQENEQ